MKNQKPLVSIIIPVYNAKHYLASSLPAIKNSDYPEKEIVIVDDNSTDGSFEFSKKYADVAIKLENRGAPGKARNKGAKVSNGSIFLFIDADVQIAPDSISKIVTTMVNNPDIGAIFGSYDDNPPFTNFFSQYKNLFHHFVHQTSNTKAGTFWAGCGAIRKEAFFKVGGFSENFTQPSIEDVVLGYRLKENNINIRLQKDLQVTHLKKWNLYSLLKADIFHRAIPWTKLSCEKGLPSDLNFKVSDKVSGVISLFFFFGLPLIRYQPSLIFLFILLGSLLFFLNKNLYLFFFKKKGVTFLLTAIFFHWFYFFYSSITFGFFFTFFKLKNHFYGEGIS